MHNAHIIIDYILIGLLIWAVVFIAYKTTELVFKYINYIKGSKQKCCGILCQELMKEIRSQENNARFLEQVKVTLSFEDLVKEGSRQLDENKSDKK